MNYFVEHDGQVNPTGPYTLGRVVRHDSRSRQFAGVERSLGTMQDVCLSTSLFPFNQGNYGSCTADAAVKAPSYSPITSAVATLYQGWTKTGDEEPTVQKFYNDEENHDGDGPFPPNDNGSSGLTAAWVAKKWGFASGYLHAFSLAAALAFLDKGAFITGTNWYSGMFTPTSSGELKATGSVEGGHEYVIFARDVANQKVWMQNSWWTPDQPWGVKGPNGAHCCAWMSFSTYEKLLGEKGDATYLVPANQPAPTPTPTPVLNEQAVFVKQAGLWAAKRHVLASNLTFAADVRTYLTYLAGK